MRYALIAATVLACGSMEDPDFGAHTWVFDDLASVQVGIQCTTTDLSRQEAHDLLAAFLASRTWNAPADCAILYL